MKINAYAISWVALLQEQHSNSGNTKEQATSSLLFTVEWFNNTVFGKEIAVGL